MKPRSSWYVISTLAVCIGLLVALAAVRAEERREGNAAEGDLLFQHLYSASIENLGRPDMTFADIEDVGDAFRNAEPVTTSKTCSQRCSQRCSVSCTTTRGCSSLCKAQTEGCQGGGSSRTNASQQEEGGATATGPIPRSPKAPFTVADLQMLLKIAGYNVTLDGKLGQETYAAVTDFQKRNGLATTGVADAELWKRLCVSLSVLAGGDQER